MVNLLLFASKVLASLESRSLAVIASTLDSFLDLLSGSILWFTSFAMKKPNQYSYPIGKKRMQPVVCLLSDYFVQVCMKRNLLVFLEESSSYVTCRWLKFMNAL